MTRPCGSTLIVAASTAPDLGRYSGFARSCGSSAIATYPMLETEGSTRQGHPDPEEAPGRPRRRLLAPQLGVARELHGSVQDRRVVAAVVETARRRPVRHLAGLDQVAPAQLDRVEGEPLREEVHHPLGLEVEVPAGVPAVRAGEALVGHHHRGVHLEVLEAVRPDEVAGGAEAASRARGCGCSRRRCRASGSACRARCRPSWPPAPGGPRDPFRSTRPGGARAGPRST